jgi:hypothetical protein
MDLRSVMPTTAVKIDFMRLRLGREVADDVIRRSMRGEPGLFYSMENLMVFGTVDTSITSVWHIDGNDRKTRVDPRWMTDALELALTRGFEFERLDMQSDEEAVRIAKHLRTILSEAAYVGC